MTTRVLLSQKMGILTKESGTNRLIPDTRKGVIQAIWDGSVKLIWCERRDDGSVSSPQLSVVLASGTVFEKIPNANRTFLLRFEDDRDPLFFWSQEPEVHKDEFLVSMITGLILRGDQSLPGSEETAAAAEEGPARKVSRPLVSKSELSHALQAILERAHGEGSQHASISEKLISLTDVITVEKVRALVSNPAFVAKLREHMPTELRFSSDELQAEEIIRVVSSPQFKEQMRILTSALNSGEINATHFGLQQGYGVRGLLDALKKKARDDEEQCQRQGEGSDKR